MSIAKSAESQISEEDKQAGLRIAQARRQLGVKAQRDVLGADMARDLGVAAETVRSWEAGQSFPRKPMLRRLAGYLGVKPEWIEYGIEEARKTLAPEPLDEATESDERRRGRGG